MKENDNQEPSENQQLTKIDSKSNKKKLFIIGSIIIATIIIFIIGYMNNSMLKFEKLYSSNQYEQAKKIFLSDIAGNSSKEEKIIEILNNDIDGILDNFETNKIDYDTAISRLNEIKSYNLVNSESSNAQKHIKDLHASELAYQKGEEYLKEKDYIRAIPQFSNVIEDDENYETAQKEIKDNLPAFKSQSINIAEDYLGKRDYDNAVKTIDEALKYLAGDKTLIQKKNDYQEQKEERKKELLSMTTHYYDDMSNTTIIVPKGYSTRYINVNWSINLEPRLIVSSSNKLELALLGINAGFKRSDWIFFDTITFKVDGTKFTWDTDYSDKKTQVVGGGQIAEWTVKSDLVSHDLVGQMTMIANSKSAKMRFSGEGYIDHVVTTSEKNNLKILLELYSYYLHP